MYAHNFIPAKVGEDMDKCAVAVFAQRFSLECIACTYAI